MEFIPVVAMAALTYKLIDFLRYARAGDTNGVFTQLIAWISGIAIALLVSQTDWADGIAIGDQSLATINIWSVIFWGMTAGSVGSAFKDATKAVDPTNSAAIPTLIPMRARHRQSTTTAATRTGTEDVG